jgi:hypothetical protein
MTVEPEKAEDLYAVYAVRKAEFTPLIQTGLPFRRLMDEVVVPFESGEVFFLDGASVKSTDLDRIKIVREKGAFRRNLAQLHGNLRAGSPENKKVIADKYHVHLEGVLRDSGEDITAQVIRAFRTQIKPSIKDYFPRREELLNLAAAFLTESLKQLSNT